MELVENTENCSEFQPHPFKKTKCRDCGRPWTEHKGVISDQYYQGFISDIRKAEEEKLRIEEEAKAKQREAKALKKQNSAAPEDKWLYDGNNHASHHDDQGESSEDDGGFQMLTPSKIQKDIPRPSAVTSQPLKVKNLIDFDECDVNEGPGLGQPGMPSYEPSTAPGTASSLMGPGPASSPPKVSFQESITTMTLGPGSLVRQAAAPVVEEAPSPSNSPAFLPTTSILAGEEDDLRAEIMLLRQQLADSVEMKNIEVDIIKDEVSMKQSEIDALAAKHEETEKQLQELRKHLEHTQLQASSATSSSAEMDPELLAKLRTELQEYREAAAKSLAQEEQLARLRDELHESRECASLEAQLLVEQAKLEGEERVSSLQAELESLKQYAASQASSAPSAAEVERLKASLAEARAREEKHEDSRRRAEVAAKLAKDEAEQERRAKLELEDLLNARSPQSSGGGSSPAKSVLSQHEALKTAELKNQEAEKVLMQIRRQAENQLRWLSQRVKEDPNSEMVAA